MYRLLFADDEHIVREGVSSRVNWGEIGFELVGVLTNGREVLDYLEDNQVDVLLSDISMPLMDGLEVSRVVSDRYPNMMVLLLTGYDQFEYAQEALKYHVSELLLKPITAAEMEDVLVRVHKELDGRMRVQQQAAELQARLEESIPLLKERFLHRLVRGQLSPEVIRRRTLDLQWDDRDGWYQVMLIHVPSSWIELNRLSFNDRAGDLLAGSDELFFNADEDIVLLLQGEDRERLLRRSEKLGPEMLRVSSRVADGPVCVTIGEPVPDLAKLRRSYDGARRAMGHARLLGMPHVVSAQEVGALRTLSVEDFHDRTRALVKTLRRVDRGQSIQAVESLFDQLEHHYLEPNAAHVYLAEIQFMLLDFLEEITQVPGAELDEDVRSLLNVQSFASLAIARDHFRTIVGRIVDILEEQKQVAVVSRVGLAERVIRKRHTESGLSLQEICDEVYLSVSQFSALFKEATGKTFVEYLTQVRIDRAMELLQSTDMRTYEVAEAVGYTDARYFTYVFKKVTGMTSSEFRKESQKEGSE